MKKVPTVDIRSYTHGSIREQAEFISIFGKALQEYGFVIVEGHEINPSIIADGYKQVQEFFSLPVNAKEKYFDKNGGGQRGYVVFGAENAKNSKQKDLKEFWHVGREQFEDTAIEQQYPKNAWPNAEIPQFKDSMLNLYSSLDKFSRVLLCAVAEYLHLPKFTLADMAKDGNTILRALHYPPLSEEQFKSGAVRSAAHEDINLITILCEATESGLQILTREGKWLDVESSVGQMVVDAGDMLARITNDVIPSTTHRVINPPNSKNLPRYSMPYFVHAAANCELKIFENCLSPSRPAKYAPILADEFLKQRLYELGLFDTPK
ncbi:MAG: 2-oxoglutarate and iron-dependent oxygenase domain-containing protein [Bdellovibrionota bacterium]